MQRSRGGFRESSDPRKRNETQGKLTARSRGEKQKKGEREREREGTGEEKKAGEEEETREREREGTRRTRKKGGGVRRCRGQREERSKSRKTGSPGPQGSFLAGLFRRGSLREISRVKSTAMLRRSLARSQSQTSESSAAAISGFASSGDAHLAATRVGFSRVPSEASARSPTRRHRAIFLAGRCFDWTDERICSAFRLAASMSLTGNPPLYVIVNSRCTDGSVV